MTDLAAEGRVRSKRQKGHFVVAGEGIWGGERMATSCSESTATMPPGEGEAAIGAADKDVGLAAVAKGFQDVGGRQKVPLFVNEEGVAKKL